MNTEIKNTKANEAVPEERVLIAVTDVYETENEYVLKADMPGVSRENIDITLNNNELEIRGKITDDDSGADKSLRQEYMLYNYYRKFTVGNDIDGGRINAGLSNGVLTLTLPKREEIKPKKIEISIN